jgi:putative aldouronate transport system substrate-binding protein
MKRTSVLLSAVLLPAVMLSAVLAISCSRAGGTSAPAASGETGSVKPITFTIWIDHNWFWFDQYGKEDVSRKMTELTGVTLDMTRATDGNQLPVMIASGDLPDLVYTSNSNAMIALSDSAVCWPMNELAARYNTDLHITDVDIANNSSPDGNYYTIMNIFIPQARYDTAKFRQGRELPP